METGVLDRALCTEVGQLLAKAEQTEQEPVAWLITATSCGGAQDWKFVSLERKAPEKLERMFPKFTPLYTSPQREPSASAREMYQRGYAQAELDSKREQEPDLTGIVEDSMVDEDIKAKSFKTPQEAYVYLGNGGIIKNKYGNNIFYFENGYLYYECLDTGLRNNYIFKGVIHPPEPLSHLEKYERPYNF